MAQNSKFSAPACTAILGDGQEFRLVLSISSSFYTNQLFVVLFTVIKYFDSMYLRICLFEVLDVKRIGYITLIKKKNEVLHNTDQKKPCLFSKFCYAKSDTQVNIDTKGISNLWTFPISHLIDEEKKTRQSNQCLFCIYFLYNSFDQEKWQNDQFGQSGQGGQNGKDGLFVLWSGVA